MGWAGFEAMAIAVAGIPFPDWIQPEVFTIPAFSIGDMHIGPLPLRWYALAYIAGLALGWLYMARLVRTERLWPTPPGAPMTSRDVEDFVFYAALGVILGGRLGSILFYNFETFLRDPLSALRIWEGGMSFHGGLIGVALAIVLFARARKIPLLTLGDLTAAVVPIGLFFGRVANFINQELWGRPTDLPWGVVFETDPERLARHPSQLYQAGLEGLLLFAVLAWLIFRRDALRQPGRVTGTFLLGYGIVRSLAETVRVPDAHLTDLPFGISMGTYLSLPMVAIGAWLVWNALKARPGATAPR
jgi:phosphatidylglycerol:prolipoprotein diacylglycerol transferase